LRATNADPHALIGDKAYDAEAAVQLVAAIILLN
jgi:hypothetical protein